jgi:hypothetical protein
VTIRINKIQSTDTPAWDECVYNHPGATLCHLSVWDNGISRTYGHKTYYLMATREPEGSKLSAISFQLCLFRLPNGIYFVVIPSGLTFSQKKSEAYLTGARPVEPGTLWVFNWGCLIKK